MVLFQSRCLGHDMTTVLLIGFGSIGKRHAKVLNRNEHDLVIVDHAEEARNQARETYPDAHVHDDLESISKDSLNSQISAGIIATWAPTHGECFDELVDLGVERILCEKPLSNSLQTAEMMCERAEKEDIRLLVNHKFRYSGALDAIKEWETEYDLGNPVHFVSTAGAVGLINKGVHLVDLAYGLFEDSPDRVVSTARSAPLNPRSDELEYYGGTSVWEFDDREAVLSYTNKSSVTQELRIYYRDAIITIDDEYNTVIRHRDQEELETNPEITRHGLASTELYADSNPFAESKSAELERAHSDLFAETEPVSPGTLGRDVVEGCVGSLAAATERKTVSFPISETNTYWTEEWSYN